MEISIYIDESGDTGINAQHIGTGKSTSYYCLGVVVCHNENPEKHLERLFSTAREKYGREKNRKLPLEFKFLRLRDGARIFLIKELMIRDDLSLFVVNLNKFQNKGNSLFSPWKEANVNEFNLKRELLRILFERLFEEKNIDRITNSGKIHIYFDENIHERYAKVLERQTRKYKQEIVIHEAQDSRKNAGIQVADLLAGAFTRYLRGQNEFFDLVKKNVSLSEVSLVREGMNYKLSHSIVYLSSKK